MSERTYINISGAAINSNKAASSFDVNASQYTTHYKNHRNLSVLPVQAHFNSNKYRTKKPIPSNNTYVSFKGFLDNIETDSTGHATTFHVSVNNINFLGRATPSPSATGNAGNKFISFSFPLLTSFLQLPPPCPVHLNSSSTLMQHLDYLPMLLYPIPLPSFRSPISVYQLKEENEKNDFSYITFHKCNQFLSLAVRSTGLH